MPIYQYKARDEEGRLITGRLEVDDPDALQVKLSNTGLFLVSYSEEKKGLLGSFSLDIAPVSLKDRFLLSLQLADIVDAGVPLLTSIETLSKETKNRKLAQALGEVYQDLKSGAAFSEALSKHPQIFSKFYVSMVRLGESSGTLGEVLRKLAEYIRREDELRAKIISTITYPIILSLVAIGLMSYLLTHVIPQFIKIFEEERISLPLPTEILLKISNFFRDYFLIILGGIIGGIILLGIIYKTPWGRANIDRIKIKFPILGVLLQKIYINRFIESLAILYNSGLPILESLRVIEDVIQHTQISEAIRNLGYHLAKGGDLVENLKLTGFFPANILMMIKVGQEGGTLGKMLERVSEVYQREIGYFIERAVSLLEPLIILSMGVGIGFLAISILFPLFKLTKIAGMG